MGQTAGGQLLGNWYDVIGWAAAAMLFFYLAYAVPSLPPQQKQMLPDFFQDRKILILIGALMMLASIGKFMRWW